MLRHFAITRLGIGITSQQWHARTLDLFEAITLPSLVRQTCQDFHWLVVVETAMPAAMRARIENLLHPHRNFHLVVMDVTRLRRMRHSCYDWIYEACQEFLLDHGLIDNPADYVITSQIDADDAWAADVVATVNSYVFARLPSLIAAEPSRGVSIRHTTGLAITFPDGIIWRAATGDIAPFNYLFHSMAVFVAARFSSGISTLSSRHGAWPSFARVVDFEAVTLNEKRPMWLYVRHNRATAQWDACDNPTPPAPTERAAHLSMHTLAHEFGVDLAKIECWRRRGIEAAEAPHHGMRNTVVSGGLFDRIFRITALNRQIDSLQRRRQRADGESAAAIERLLIDRSSQRLALIEDLRQAGATFG
jgi:hypothetical protein